MSEHPLPSPMDLLMRSFDALKDDLGGFLLAGVIPMVITFGLAFVMVGAAYTAMFLGMLPGLILENEIAAILGGFGLFFVALVGIGVMVGVVMAPLTASLMRAVAKAQQEGGKLSVNAPLETPTQDLGRVIRVYLMVSTLGFIGTMACYVPGLVAGFLLVFAIPGVVLDRLGVGEAISRSVSHAQAHVGWHAGVFAIVFFMYVILSQIPIVGYILAMTLTADFIVRAYRSAFPLDQA